MIRRYRGIEGSPAGTAAGRARSRRRSGRAASYMIAFAALAAPLHAQPAEGELPLPPRWTATVDLGFNGSSGNTRLAVFSTGFQVRHLLTEEFTLEWSGNFRYGESEGEVVARNVRSTLSFDLFPKDRVSPFVFSTIERDRFRRLRVRSDGGGGVKFVVHRAQDTEASLSGALLYSHESFTPQAGGVVTPARTDGRWSVRARGRTRLTDGLRMEHTSFLVPVWDDVGDYNFDAVSRLALQLNERLAIGVSHNFRYDSTPPPDVLRADQTLQANFTIQF
jgi:putative salt-induced outer membrane protein YdiY